MSTEEQGAAARAPTEDTILDYRPGLGRVLSSIDWPATLYLAFLFYFLLSQMDLGWGATAALALTASVAVIGCTAWAVSGATLVIVDSDSVTFQRLGKRKVALDHIAQVKIPKWNEWTRARAVLEMKRANPKRFWRLELTSYKVALPGDLRFQAEVVNAMLARRPDVPADKRALRLLAGKLELTVWNRLPTLAAAGIGVATLLASLVVSFRGASVSFWWPFPLTLTVFAVPFTYCLERDSSARRAIASLGVSALPATAGFSIATFLYGGLEYVPMVHAAALALAAGAFVAALPRAPRAWAVALGTAALLGGLLGVTWHVTLGDTIPVREVFLAPPPWGAAFSPDGRTLITTTNSVREEGLDVHFYDMRSGRAKTVGLGEGDIIYSCVPLPGGRAVCYGDLDRKPRLWFVSTQGRTRTIPVEGSLGFLSRHAVSPDGRRFAFYTSEHLPKVIRVHSKDCRHVRTLHLLDTESGDVSPGGLRLERNYAGLSSLLWRSDGRLVWGGIESRERTDDGSRVGTFHLWSWTPGEAASRLEFESREPWSDVYLSPGCDMAVARVHREDSSISALIRFAEGRADVSVLPGVESQRSLLSDTNWSADGSVYVFVPETDPRAIRIVRTATVQVSTLCRAPFGGIEGTLVSPRGRHVAFSIRQDYSEAMFVADTATCRVRRLRPLVFPLISLGSGGGAAWSPSGDWLAVPAFARSLKRAGAFGEGPVWLVSADDM